MGIKVYKPVTNGSRNRTGYDFSELTTDEPYKKLTVGLKKTGGRNNLGRITVFTKSGGHKRLYRIIDFKRDKRNIWARVETIEYDPNRTARICRVVYEDGERRYILAPLGIKVGDKIMAGENAPIQIGCALPLRNIPVGTIIHNIELQPGRGGQLARAGGTFARLEAKEGNYAIIKLPSGEIRMVLLDCYATIGQVSNPDVVNIRLGKAGRSRWLGIKPKVRGVAMNPIDHPHGGGEGGKQKGYPYPMTPWAKPTLGYKTRKKNKQSDKYILQRRK